MNFEQRGDLLNVLYDKRSEVFFKDFENLRESRKRPEVIELDGLIEAFKSLTTDILDIAPENLVPHDGIGDLLTVEEWTSEGTRGMAFIPSDGCGNWATAEGFSYDYSDVFGHIPAWATHMVWCNN